jgi:hypothetical protein
MLSARLVQLTRHVPLTSGFPESVYRFLIYQFSVISTVLESSHREIAAIDPKGYTNPIAERLPAGKR